MVIQEQIKDVRKVINAAPSSSEKDRVILELFTDLIRNPNLTGDVNSPASEENDLQSDSLLNSGNRCTMFGAQKVDGDKCLNLIEKCLVGTDISGCVAEWENINFSMGINYGKVDFGAVANLLTKMGINWRNDENAVAKWKADNKLASIAPQLTSYLVGLVNHLRSRQGLGRTASNMPPRYPAQTGGGRNDNSIQMFDYISKQFSLYGGNGCLDANVVVLLRANFDKIVKDLSANGTPMKQNEVQDFERHLNKLENYEDKIRKTRVYLARAQTLLKRDDFKQILQSQPTATQLTTKVLNELTEKHKDLLDKYTGRTSNILSLFGMYGFPNEIKSIQDSLQAIKKALKI